MIMPFRLKKAIVAFLVCLSLVVALSGLTTVPSTASQGTASSGVGPIGIVRLDETPRPFRVEPPSQFRLSSVRLATITVNYYPAGATNPLGDTCYAWPPAAQAAFSYGANIWASLVSSSVPIVIGACWASLESGVLGHSAATFLHRDFPNAPVAGTWYQIALANSLARTDLAPSYTDMEIAYSKNIGSWYFGTDGRPSASQADFVSVVLHEIAHGLGFSGSMRVSGGVGSWGLGTSYPIIYDRFIKNGSNQSLLNTALFPNPSAALAGHLTGNNLYFDGPIAKSANSGNRVRIYAPSTWRPGSSFSHLDEVFNGTANALMTFSISLGESVHDPGPVGLGVLRDVGWRGVASHFVYVPIAVKLYGASSE